ncbi:MAG: Hsp70 family protein [Planctomycetales bacterium]|nr:Hsp70 family protein [Planctomycetales bacterium]
MSSSKYVVGIDLGTTNSVVAFVEADASDPEMQILRIPQVVAEGMVEKLDSLPSFAYIPRDHEEASRTALPWESDADCVVGQFARAQSAEAPERTIGAAKSWLAHTGVDRRENILPWNAPDDVKKVSPVSACQGYLQHIRNAWDAEFPEDRLANQDVVVTVPASFDASARDLIREAAVAAGLPTNFMFLEEPQSAVYAWLGTVGDEWRKHLSVGDSLLVCDVGGGTTDLTLVKVCDVDGNLELRRAAVGNHLLVGGDNMDLALAHHVAEQFKSQKVNLDPWQSVSLWHSCRAAKEVLLARDGAKSHKISVLGRSSKLIGGTKSIEVDRQAVGKLLADGFFPPCDLSDKPQRQRMSGFQQIGLPYETDTAVTKHVASFLSDHCVDDDGNVAQPTHVLFNGGVFRSATLRGRMVNVLDGWFSDPIEQLAADDQSLDQSVARGAAFYAWSKRNGGVRIRGGTARSYYVGIETAGLAIPGAPRPLRALCVVPFGMEEGTEIDVPSAEIGLVLGEPVHFRFFSSSNRHADQPGDTLDSWTEEDLHETDSMEAELPASQTVDQGYVPVRFESRVTELGVFELWCVSTKSDERWKLEFSVRDTE